MTAKVLRSGGTPSVPDENGGSYIEYQDPATGEIIRDWHPDTDAGEEDESYIIDCYAAQATQSLISNTERWGREYIDPNQLKLSYSPEVHLTKRDRVTEIRDKRTGNLVYVNDDLSAATYNVEGLAVDNGPFGVVGHIAFLFRAEYAD